ncbi:MAG: hypothetical protein U0414_38075 [Polyangiaceae bacterium]
MKTTLFAAAAMIALFHVGCGSPKDTAASASPSGGASAPNKDAAKKDDKPADKPAEKPAEKKEEAKATKIDAIGLTAMLPAGGQIMKGMSEGSAMITSDATTMNVSVAKDTDPKTVEQGKDSALLGDKGRGLKGDKIADGWIVTWENTGSMGDNYWLSMRREIGGKGYMCETTVSNENQRKAAIEICNSLKP